MNDRQRACVVSAGSGNVRQVTPWFKRAQEVDSRGLDLAAAANAIANILHSCLQPRRPVPTASPPDWDCLHSAATFLCHSLSDNRSMDRPGIHSVPTTAPTTPSYSTPPPPYTPQSSSAHFSTPHKFGFAPPPPSNYPVKCSCCYQLPSSFLRAVSDLPTAAPHVNTVTAAAAFSLPPGSLVNSYHVYVMYTAISALYKEQIPPAYEEIRRRLDKHNPCQFLSSSFLQVCRAHAVVPSNPSNYSFPAFPASLSLPFSATPFRLDDKEGDLHIYLNQPPPDFQGFIDPNSSCFPYPVDYLAVVFFHLVDRYRIDPKGEAYKGGRFLLAELLRCDGPYALRELSQGQLCHLLQKCLDLGILSYENNSIRAAVACTALSKAYAARNGAAMKPQDKAKREQRLSLIKTRLAQFLQANPAGLAMCRLPIMYKQEYDCTLNLQSLGYTKLADFLLKEASDLCTIRPSARHRCLVLPVNAPSPPVDPMVLHQRTAYSPSGSDVSAEGSPVSFPSRTPLKSFPVSTYTLLCGEVRPRSVQLSLLVSALRTHCWYRLISFKAWQQRAPNPAHVSYATDAICGVLSSEATAPPTPASAATACPELSSPSSSPSPSCASTPPSTPHAVDGAKRRSYQSIWSPPTPEAMSNHNLLAVPLYTSVSFPALPQPTCSSARLPSVDVLALRQATRDYIHRQTIALSTPPPKQQSDLLLPVRRMPLDVTSIPCEFDGFSSYYNAPVCRQDMDPPSDVPNEMGEMVLKEEPAVGAPPGFSVSYSLDHLDGLVEDTVDMPHWNERLY
eukprot:GHVQ01008162.1.p1 GENE.GHVQ01008162.1~~GHVQ01008162.1.p1  ORF type:complete len:788 (+),score=110.75 GHVQ01008162.1:238-2601(+)